MNSILDYLLTVSKEHLIDGVIPAGLFSWPWYNNEIKNEFSNKAKEGLKNIDMKNFLGNEFMMPE
jgi:hypothetical protein